jgi:hypothetical protein
VKGERTTGGSVIPFLSDRLTAPRDEIATCKPLAQNGLPQKFKISGEWRCRNS